MFKNFIQVQPQRKTKKGEPLFVFKFRWSGVKWIKTKNPLKTLNRCGVLFYFTPEYLQKKGLIDNLGVVELYSYRRKYGRLKNACILELK